MKILSYRELIKMRPVLAAEQEKPISSVVLGKGAWQGEIIALMGPRQSCLSILCQVLLIEDNLPSTEVARTTIDSIMNLSWESDLFNSELTLTEYFNSLLGKVEYELDQSERESFLKQIFWAAYLQPYTNLPYRHLSQTVRQRASLVYLFLSSKTFILVPDLLSSADEQDKILIQKTIQSLRLLFHKSKTIFFYTQNPEEAIFLSDRVLLLTQYPTNQVGEIVPVLFKEPRHRHIISQLPAFKVIRKKINNALLNDYAPLDLPLPVSLNLLS